MKKIVQSQGGVIPQLDLEEDDVMDLDLDLSNSTIIRGPDSLSQTTSDTSTL